MAFIPDNSFQQRFTDKISPLLWEFYQYLCIKRNHEKRTSQGTVEHFVEFCGYKRASKFNLIKELKNTSWIGGTDGEYTLLVGDFSSVDKKADERKAKRESKKIDSTENQSKNLDSQSKKIDDSSKKIDSHIRNIPASLPAEPEEKKSLSASAKASEVFGGEENGLADDPTIEGLKLRLKTPVVLPDAHRWLPAIARAKLNGYDGQHFLDVYDVLENLRRIQAKNYRITPEMIERDVGNLPDRQQELKKLENGEIQNGNGNSYKQSQTNSIEAKQKRLDAIIADSERFESPQIN